MGRTVVRQQEKSKNRPTRFIARSNQDSYLKKWSKSKHQVVLHNDVVDIFANMFVHVVDTITDDIRKRLGGVKQRKTAKSQDARYAVVGLTNNVKFQEAVLKFQSEAVASFKK